MSSYIQSFIPERRFQIEQIICFICYIFCLGVLNFHVFHICGFSTTSCMSSQIQDALLKTNQTYRNLNSEAPQDFNLTSFLEQEVDLFYFRIVDSVNSLERKNTKSIYLSPDGDMTIRRG